MIIHLFISSFSEHKKQMSFVNGPDFSGGEILPKSLKVREEIPAFQSSEQLDCLFGKEVISTGCVRL